MTGDVTADLSLRLAGYPAAVVGDAMDRLGTVHGIHAVWSGARLAGPALTVWTRAGDNKTIHDALALARPGDVLVVNGEGDTTRALVGDLIARRAMAVGIAGMVIDGMARDATGLAELGFPVFARGVTPAGPFKNGPGRIGEPVALGTVAVLPGDIVLGDDDGVVVVPRARAVDIADAAAAVQRREENTRLALEPR